MGCGVRADNCERAVKVCGLTEGQMPSTAIRHFPVEGVLPVVTTSSTAEEECPVRETYWTGGSSIAVREARAVNRYY